MSGWGWGYLVDGDHGRLSVSIIDQPQWFSGTKQDIPKHRECCGDDDGDDGPHWNATVPPTQSPRSGNRTRTKKDREERERGRREGNGSGGAIIVAPHHVRAAAAAFGTNRALE